MTWEETTAFIQSGHKSPSEFQQNTLKTIELNEKDGIQAIIGKPKGKPTTEIQTYIFLKNKGWTKQTAEAWYNKLHTPTNQHLCAVLPFTITEKIADKPLRIQGLALTVGMSRNFNIYTPQELEAFSGKLIEAPVYLEHVTAQDAIGKVTKTQWDGVNLQYEAEIYDEETADKIRKGLIRHVSVGADYQTLDLVNGKVPHGLFNAEMSLVAVPGIPEANIEILEKLREQQYEPILSGEYTLGFYQDPAAFLPQHFSTIWLDREKGILSIAGKLKKQPETQRTAAIYFSQDKQWTDNQITDWIMLHPAYTTPAAEQPSTPEMEVIESLIKKTNEPTIPLSQAIHLIEEVLPNHIVQRSWSLGPQRMCQELNRVLYRLRNMQNQTQNQSHNMTASN